jgi:hypothetical protein
MGFDERLALASGTWGRCNRILAIAPATVTPTRLEADLGALGRISAEIVPSGKKKLLRSRCA